MQQFSQSRGSPILDTHTEGGKLLIAHSSLTLLADIKANTLSQKLSRGRKDGGWQSIKIGQKSYIYYDSLPTPIQVLLSKHISATTESTEPIPNTTLIYKKAAQAAIVAEDYEWLSLQGSQAGTQLNELQKQDLMQVLGWLRWLAQQYDRYPQAFVGRGKVTSKEKRQILTALHLPVSEAKGIKETFLQYIANIIAEEKRYGLRCSNYRRLDDRVQAFRKSGRDSIVHGNFANTNAQKIPPLALQRMIDLYADPKKLGMNDVTRIVKAEFHLMKLDESTVSRVLNHPEHKRVWLVSREGVSEFREQTETIFKRKRPLHPDSMWAVDGTTIQLLVQHPDGTISKVGYYVLVVDVYSQKIIGCAIGKTETSQLVQKALRDAIRKTGYVPRYLQFDHASANKSSEVKNLLTDLSIRGLACAPYNGKAKIIERVIGVLEQNFLRFYDNFTGGNVTTRSQDSKANVEYLAKQKKEGSLPTAEKGVAQVVQAIATYNNTQRENGETPNKQYEYPHEKRNKIGELTLVEAFWTKRRDTSAYRAEGIRLEIEGIKHYYQVESKRGIEDMDFKSNYLGNAFTIRYNPEALDCIHLYDEKGTWVAKANSKYEYAPNPSEATKEEINLRNEAQQDRKKWIEESQNQRKELRENMEAQGFLVPDFRMVHKDALNALEEGAVLESVEYSSGANSYYTTVRTTLATKTSFELYGDEGDCSIIQ